MVAQDSDGDGMPDAWEIAHGLNPNSASDATLDSDGDGYTNLQEFLAGTNPQAPESSVGIGALESSNQDVLVSFSTIAGKLYRLERSLVSPIGPWTTVMDGVVGTGTEVTISDANANIEPKAFYRLCIQE